MLISVTVLLGLALHAFPRLKEIDFSNLKMTLRELQETKEELFIREEKLKATLIPFVEIIAFQAAAEGRWAAAEFSDLKRKWYKIKLDALIDVLGLTSLEAQEIQKFVDKYAEIDKLFAGRETLKTTDHDYKEVKNKIQALSEQINEMLRRDIN